MDTEEKDGIFLLFICIWSVAYCVYIYLYMTGRVWPTIGQGTNEALSQAYMLALALVVCAFVQKYLQRILEKN
jgi:small neutral amino acid transporter SnatA (MarC family)